MAIDQIKTIGVIGAGTMGSQIALQCALSGYEVAHNDISDDILAKGAAGNRSLLERRVTKGSLSTEEMETVLKRIKPYSNLEEAAPQMDFVIEAAFEKLAVKQELFGKLDKFCRPAVILASNSSTIIISKIAEHIERKDKALNMHFFHPATYLKLVEVVRGQWTSEETVQTTVELVKQIGKEPVIINREIFGFIVNRVLFALQHEAFMLAQEGYASPEDIDKAIKLGLNHPMGPFELADFSGIDILYLAGRQRYQETGDDNDKPMPIIEKKYKQGEYGRKTGKGFYEYQKKS